MATKTFTVTKQMQSGTGSGTSSANPGDAHIPLGLWDPGTGLNWVTRACLYAPVSFTGMVGINSARLYFYTHTASGWHANGSGTNYIGSRRKTADWAESSAGTSTSVDEIWGGNGASIVMNDYVNAGGSPTACSADTADGTLVYVDITEEVKDWFAGSPNYGVMVFAADSDNTAGEDSSAKALEFYSRHVSGKQPYIWIDYSTNTAPAAPVSLSPTGNAIVNTGTAVTVSGTRSDADSGDYITGVTIYVYKDDGTTIVDSETYYPSGTPTTFSRVMSVPNGHAYYKWKARTRDKDSAWGPYSALQRFKANTVPNAPTISLVQSPTTSVKTLTPTFNITRSDADSSYGDDMASYQIDLETSGGSQIWDSSEVAVTAGTVTAQRVYNGPALSWRTSYRWRARTKDENGAWSAWTGYATFTTYSSPAPTSLSPTGNVTTSTLTPTLSGARGDTSHTIASYQLELYESNGTTLKWSSGTLTTGITNGASFAKVYNGAALSYSTQYKWRARITGNIGGTSVWTALQSFTTRAADEVEQTSPIGEPITTLTPGFNGTWTTTLDAVQIILYEANGTTVKWDSGTSTQAAATSFSRAYGGTALLWNTTYQWKVRVRRSADQIWQAYSGLVSFTTDSAGQPTLTAPINDSWETTLTPTFTGTTFNAEGISTFRIRVYENDGVTLKWDSGDLAGSGTTFSKVYSGAALVAGRSYKWQARYVKSTGPTGAYSAFETFHINAAPQSPLSRVPDTGAIVVDSLVPVFSADFADSDLSAWGDYPVQMEIEVLNNDTNALIGTQVLTTGLIAGTNEMTWSGPALAYETTYKWRVRYRDSKNVDGAWSSYNTFKPSQSSSVTITGPGATITSPQVPVTWAFSSPSGKAQGRYRVRVIRNFDEILMYDSGEIISSENDHTIPAGYLQNNTEYTFEVTTVDVDGI